MKFNKFKIYERERERERERKKETLMEVIFINIYAY
jgi:hypothetical protein